MPLPLSAAELAAAIAADPKERALLAQIHAGSRNARPLRMEKYVPAPIKEPFSGRRRSVQAVPRPPSQAARIRAEVAQLEADLPPASPALTLNPALVVSALVAELRDLIDQAQVALTIQRRMTAMTDVYRLLLFNLAEDLGETAVPVLPVSDIRSKRRTREIVAIRHQTIATALVAGIPDQVVLDFFAIARTSLTFIRRRAGIHGRPA